MPRLEWEKPPFTGRRLHAAVPASGSFSVEHNSSVPALHEGRLSTSLRQAGRQSASVIYWSRYRFEVSADHEEDVGPWLLLVHATVAATVSIDTFAPGSSSGALGLLAVVRRLKDGSVASREFLVGRATGRILRGEPIHEVAADIIITDAEAYRLDLFSYASIAVVQPKFQWRPTSGTLNFSTLGAGASILIQAV